MPSSNDTQMENNPLVVIIGGSAGSLAPLERLFKQLPADTGAAFIVVTHQSPQYPTLLDKIIGRLTPMPVIPVKEPIKVAPNHVYTAEPETLIQMEGDKLMVNQSAAAPKIAPIDYCFKAVSEVNGAQVIGLILSGLRSDGALGAMAIRDRGGIVLVQSPGCSEYPSMPQAAIEKGAVDYILEPDEMASQLLAEIQKKHASGGNQHLLPLHLETVRAPLREIFDLLLKQTGCDFSLYKKGTISRQLTRRMNLKGARGLDSYVELLKQDPTELDDLFQDLLVEVTYFFRDPEAYQLLKDAVLPELLSSIPDGESVRVWVPACSTGEEAYSLAIVIQECLDELERSLPVMIFATDMSDSAIDTARRARYPDGIVDYVSEERLKRFFDHKGGYFQVCSAIREQVIFARQNLINDPPFTKLDFISCRNFLIYLDGPTQQQLIKMFHFALKPQGILFLGESESITGQEQLFVQVGNKHKLFRRKEAAVTHKPSWGFNPLAALQSARTTPIENNFLSKNQNYYVDRLVSEILLRRHAPPSVLVNRHGHFLFLHGRTGEFLEPPEGNPAMTLFEMARPGLKGVLPKAFQQAEDQQRMVMLNDLSVKTNGSYSAVDVTVTAFHEPDALNGLFLVSFYLKAEVEVVEEAEQGLLHAKEPEIIGTEDYGQLKLELNKAKDSLQLAIQQKDWALQDLQAANEELQSTNEELQSTNEELETSREELQSMNEELTTINAELESRVSQLYNANDDMQNLLNSIEVATIFLDNRLNVKRFTQKARELIHLREADIGRPLTEINHKLLFDHLIDEAEQVLDSLAPFEAEVESVEGHYYLLRIQAYQTSKNVITGVVITFVNIDRIKQLEDKQDNVEFYQGLLKTVQQPLAVLNERCEVVAANESFNRLSRVDNLVGQALGLSASAVWNIPELNDALAIVLAKQTAVTNLPVTLEFPEGSTQCSVNLQPLVLPKHPNVEIILAVGEANEKE